jgi:hypothetical protein
MIGRPTIAHGILKPGNSRIYDPEAQAYFNVVSARGGSISDIMKDKIESFIIYLRDTCPVGNQWQYIDRVWAYNNTSMAAALTSIKNPTSNVSQAMNSPIWSPATGFTLDGSTQYIKSGFWGGNGVAFAPPSLFMGGTYYQDGNSNPSGYDILIGSSEGTWPNGGHCWWMPAPGHQYTVYCTDSSGTRVTPGSNMNSWNTCITRRQGNSCQHITNQNTVYNDGGLGSGFVSFSKEFYIGCNNWDGTPGNFFRSSRPIKGAIIGGGAAADIFYMKYAIDTYLS